MPNQEKKVHKASGIFFFIWHPSPPREFWPKGFESPCIRQFKIYFDLNWNLISVQCMELNWRTGMGPQQRKEKNRKKPTIFFCYIVWNLSWAPIYVFHIRFLRWIMDSFLSNNYYWWSFHQYQYIKYNWNRRTKKANGN